MVVAAVSMVVVEAVAFTAAASPAAVGTMAAAIPVVVIAATAAAATVAIALRVAATAVDIRAAVSADLPLLAMVLAAASVTAAHNLVAPQA